ncbi:MAG: DNA polymerase III subunit delta [Bacilli bacterium]
MNNTYLIYGNDYKQIKREVDVIIESKKDVVRYDLSECNVNQLIDDASTISMFGDVKVVIGENALFLTSMLTSMDHDIDYLSKYLCSDNTNIVIFTVISEKLDERKKIVKLFRKTSKIINNEKIDEKNLPYFVLAEFQRASYKISLKDASYFISYVGTNIDIIINEIDKLMLYKDEDKDVVKEDINMVCSAKIKDNIFELTDGIMTKDYKKTFDCYYDLIKNGEEPVKIIAILANHFRLLHDTKIMLKSGLSPDEISKKLEVHPYRVKLAIQSDFLESEIASYIKKLFALDYKIKSGKIDKNVGLEKFLMEI